MDARLLRMAKQKLRALAGEVVEGRQGSRAG
jgi:hypothetical protein